MTDKNIGQIICLIIALIGSTLIGYGTNWEIGLGVFLVATALTGAADT